MNLLLNFQQFNTNSDTTCHKHRPKKKPIAQLLIPLLLTLNTNFASATETSINQKEQPAKPTVEQNLLSQTKPASWRFLHPYTAQYQVYSEGELLGEAKRQLQLNKNQWRLSSDAQVSKYFFKVRSSESSEFEIKQNQLFTSEFNSKTKITFKKAKKMAQKFDWSTGIEVGNKDKKSWQLNHQHLVFDRMSHLLQIRSDLLNKAQELIYPVSYKGQVQQFNYIIEATETINTKMGSLETVRLVRTKNNGDIFKLWLSPKLNFFPVQIAQYEKGEPDITMLLESLEYLKLNTNNNH